MHFWKYDHIRYMIFYTYSWSLSLIVLKDTTETYFVVRKCFILNYNSIFPFPRQSILLVTSWIHYSIIGVCLTNDMLGRWDISVRQEAMSLNQIVKADIDHDSICLSWTGVSFCQTWIIREILGWSGAWTPAKRFLERVSLHEDEIYFLFIH